MRLEPLQIQEIHSVLKKFLQNFSYELYLYGSRLDDSLRGGDIDLLVVMDPQAVELFRKIELDLLVAIKKQKSIGQRKIDLKAATQNELTEHPFLKTIAPSMRKL